MSAAAGAKKKGKGSKKKRAQRATSNVFAMFAQAQIQEFKEAFNMIDQNRDGFIDKEDLHDMFASLGKDPQDSHLEEMVNEASGPINFTMFLTLFGEKLNGTDPEDVIKNAFGCFDEERKGYLKEDYLRGNCLNPPLEDSQKMYGGQRKLSWIGEGGGKKKTHCPRDLSVNSIPSL